MDRPHLGTKLTPQRRVRKSRSAFRNAVGERRGEERRGEEGGVRLLEAVAKISTNQKTVQSDAA
jgi:hypothetical protein